MSLEQHLPAEDAVLPSLITYRAKESADKTFAVFPSEKGDSRHVSFAEFAQACSRFGRAIAPDGPAKEGHVVGIIANVDSLLYLAAIGGLTFAGLTAYAISPRTPAVAIANMLKSVKARTVLVSSETLPPSVVPELKDEFKKAEIEVEIKEIPALSDIYPDLKSNKKGADVELLPVPKRKVFAEGTEVYLHSSGSSGFPKSIPYTHEFIYALQYQSCFTKYHYDNVLCSAMLPSFHCMGFMFQLMHPLQTGKAVSLFAPQHPKGPLPVTPESVIDGVRKSKSKAAFVMPSILEAWSHDEKAIETLRNMDWVAYSGGPLALEAGDRLVKQGVRILPIYGLTETGCAVLYDSEGRKPEDWAWFELADHIKPRWIEHGDGMYELQLLSTEQCVLARTDLPDVSGYATQDLFKRHPERKELYRPVGRIDDVLMLSNGEKVVPSALEGALLAHPLVKGALVFGRGHEQIGVLVEPKEDDKMSADQFKKEIWPAVEAANKQMPTFGRLFKEMILLTTPGKPLPRAAKGTVSGKAAFKEYEKEIEALYEGADAAGDEGGDDVAPPEDPKSPEQVAEWLGKLLASLVGHDIKDDSDVFQQGLDSLTATLLRRRIISALKGSSDEDVKTAAKSVGQDFAYAHPTVKSMAEALTGGAKPEDPEKRKKDVMAVLEEHTKGLKDLKVSKRERPEKLTIVLTGSTGHLGTHILECLLSEDKVAHVYAFNRPSKAGSSLERHEKALSNGGLDKKLAKHSKLSFLEGNAYEENMGLSKEEYSKLSKSVDVIIHNAWQLDFNLDCKAFDKHIAATRRIVLLAAESNARVLLASSISVAGAWSAEQGAFPEDIQSTPDAALGGGYGESKWVAEQILEAARERGLETSALRLGQIDGANGNGAWSTSDWVPMMIKSSIPLEALPESKGVVSWISPLTVAKAFTEASLATKAPPAGMNVCHDSPVPWKQVMDDVAAALVDQGITKKKLPTVSLDDWMARLEERAEKGDAKELDAIPAIKLYGFFNAAVQREKAGRESGKASKEALGVADLDTTKARETCSALRKQTPLAREEVARWIGYWKDQGVFA